MNRRRFLELMGVTVAAGTVAYSFPSVIVPQNLIEAPSGLGLPYTRLTQPRGNYTIQSEDDVVNVRGNITLTLPALHSQPIFVVPQDGAMVTLVGNGLTHQVTKPTYLVSNGSRWFML